MYDNSSEPKKGMSETAVVAVVGLVVVAVLLGLVTMFTAMRHVDTGHVGVVTQYGRVTGRELSEGFAWVAPWGANNVTEYSIQSQKDEVEVASATSDLQDVKGKLVLNYALNRGSVSEIHRTVGKDYKDKIIIPALQETFKAASAKYQAAELITKRSEVKADVNKQLQERLKKYGITVQDVSITDFTFGAEFSAAIEAVQVANQNVAKARQELETVKVQAEKDIAAANGQAEAQRVQQQSLTPELLQKYAIDKWNGVLPTTQAGGDTNFNLPIR